MKLKTGKTNYFSGYMVENQGKDYPYDQISSGERGYAERERAQRKSREENPYTLLSLWKIILWGNKQ